MDYEKKYKEALERARKIENREPIDVPDGTSIPVAIFPELKKSDDERIRKELIDYLKERKSCESYGQCILRYDRWITWLENLSEQSSNILWHDVSEEPEARGEIFCEWKSSTDTWHSIVFYLPNSKTFCEGERIVKNVLRWTYVDEMLGKQVEQKSITSTSDPCAVSDSELIDKTITIPDGYSAHIKDNKVYINKQDKSGLKPKFRVKYAGSEYNVLEVKEISGIIFYGIDDEPNHIDFIQASNCEII